MPIYEYKCNNCDEIFDKLVSFSHKDEIECPECNSVQTTKLMSAFASSGNSNGASGGSCGPVGSGFS